MLLTELDTLRRKKDISKNDELITKDMNKLKAVTTQVKLQILTILQSRFFQKNKVSNFDSRKSTVSFMTKIIV